MTESNLIAECGGSSQIETTIAGTLRVSSSDVSDETIVSIIGEDKRLILSDLEGIKKTILEIYNQE